MYDKAGFNDYFANVVGASKNACDTYRSFLNRIDQAIGGLDEALLSQGMEAVAQWARDTDKEPFATYRSHARSVLKRYSLYRLEKASDGVDDDTVQPTADVVTELADAIVADANFLREREMQTQVRQQLAALEAGLVAIDGGTEVSVATGRIDILARDAQGRTVVIELKAGKCPAGALEQLLAYAYDIEQEHGTPVRAMLVAGSFPDRIRAAARRAGDVELRTYAYSLQFATPG
ncbi:endonuclease NucS [Sphingomonas sp. 2R-10]|uniref:endonuclease NucS domain-containing protein n=1 Tax=Sphingomonas sp. 2R-10 TaxID=3045148 RepID=UPI000F7781AC|nr:endonuclease NucS domain-containing protein [Sphingomonas sp. 2R-10]MDJ0275694.1 endonuclease NucS [Sphingomonas sp. 2R-10]